MSRLILVLPKWLPTLTPTPGTTSQLPVYPVSRVFLARKTPLICITATERVVLHLLALLVKSARAQSQWSDPPPHPLLGLVGAEGRLLLILILLLLTIQQVRPTTLDRSTGAAAVAEEHHRLVITLSHSLNERSNASSTFCRK